MGRKGGNEEILGWVKILGNSICIWILKDFLDYLNELFNFLSFAFVIIRF
jgi:hypothetical protein